MDTVLLLFWAVVFLLLIWKHPFFKIKGIPQWTIIAFFVCKILASCLLHYIYTDYYHCRSDVFKYYNDALALFDSIHYSLSDFLKILFGIDMDSPSIQQYIENTDDWTRAFQYGYITDNQTIIRVNMLLMLIGGCSMKIQYLFANFISLVSYFLIFKTFSLLYKNTYILLIFIFLIPSSILWNAAMLKEVLVMLGLGMTTYGMVQILRSFSWKYLILFCMGLLILVGIKIYVLVALSPALVAYFCNERFALRRKWVLYVSLCIAGVLTLGIGDFALHKIPFFESFAGKRSDSINLAIIENAGSLLPLEKIEPTPWNFISETPEAIWNSLALPYIWDIKGIIQIAPALESLLFFVLLALVIFFYKKPEESQKNFIWFCLCFSVVLLWEIGIATAVVGGIARYKIPIFPFLYTTLAVLIAHEKIKSKVS
ncbi:MAG: hypothetical protein J6W37_03490 [Bacteroidales bacterium]|nr:hypothetical protein [Bacteroidales bacterium]